MSKQRRKGEDHPLSETASKLEESAKKASLLRGEIHTEVSELEDTSKAALAQLNAKEEELKANVASASSVFENMRNVATASLDQIVIQTDGVMRALDDAYNRIETYTYQIIILSAAIFYVVYAVVRGVVYDPEVFVGLVTFVLIMLAGWRLLSRLRSNVNAARFETNRSLRQARSGLGYLHGHQLKLDPRLKSTGSNITKGWDLAEKIVGSVRNFLPAVGEEYANRERMSRQQSFTLSMQNALREYGFEISGEMTGYFRRFGPFTDSEAEWLDRASHDLSPVLGVAPAVVTLAYADFISDQEQAKNSWAAISGDKSTVSELARVLIENGVIDTEYVSKRLASYGGIDDLISKQSLFNLDEFRVVYNGFYVQHVREKLALLDALAIFRIDYSKVDESIRKFSPKSLDSESRLDELFDFAGHVLTLPSELIALIYFERQTNPAKRLAAWEKILRKKDLLHKFASILLENELVEIPSHYKRNKKATNEFIVGVLEKFEGFSLPTLQSSVYGAFSKLDLTKSQVLRSLSTYQIPLDETTRESFASLPSVDAAVEDIVNWLSNRVGIPSDVLLLFYRDYMQDTAGRRMCFDEIRAKKEVDKLAETLLKNSVISISGTSLASWDSAVMSLSLILSQEPEFNTIPIRDHFRAYHELLDFSRDMLSFFSEEGVTSGETQVDYNRILLLLEQGIQGELERVRVLTENIIRSSTSFWNNDESWLNSSSLALLIVYLESRENPLRRDACIRSASDDKCSRILYQFTQVREDDQQRPFALRTSLIAIVQNVIQGTYTNFEYLILFKRELNAGFLYPKISQLLEARLTTVDKQLDQLGEKKQKLEETLNRIRSIVRRFLETRLRESAIIKSLNMRLVSAYMITSSSQERVFGDVINDYLPAKIRELANQDSKYSDLLILGPRTSAGRNTRLGLVPFNMSFEHFTTTFREVFQLAVKSCMSDMGRSAEAAAAYTANVIRVYPSNLFFKRIDMSDEAPEHLPPDHPINVIRDLILERYSPVHNLELVASVQNHEDKSVAMKNILTSIFNEDTSLYLIVRTEMQGIISGSKIVGKMESGDFDKELLSRYGHSSLTELGETIYRLESGGSKSDKLLMMEHFADNVALTAKSFGARLTDEQLRSVTDNLFAALHTIGSIMDGFADVISRTASA